MAKWIYDKINSNYFLIGDVCLTNKEYQGKIGSLFFKCPLQKLAHLSVTERIFLWGPGHSAAHFFKSTMPTFSKELCSCFQKDYAQLPTLSKGLCQRIQKDSVHFFVKHTLWQITNQYPQTTSKHPIPGCVRLALLETKKSFGSVINHNLCILWFLLWIKIWLL